MESQLCRPRDFSLDLLKSVNAITYPHSIAFHRVLADFGEIIIDDLDL
jgi:hypothetical protein